MANLLAPRAPLEVDFLTSLPLNLLLTMALVAAADDFEGLDEWLREARSTLPPDLRQEIALLTGFAGGKLRFVETVAARLFRIGEDAQCSYTNLMARLRDLPAAEFQQMALQALCREESDQADRATATPGELGPKLSTLGLHLAGSAGAAPIADAEDLKTRFLEALACFWNDLYQQAYQECLPLMERSVAYHRGQAYPAQFDELFLAVTGRILPAELQAYLPEARRARFVPSCHLGPYVAFFRQEDLLTIFYNCRGTLLEERRASERVRHLYPLLKALADETRLQILLLLCKREMYAQEIVDRLGLSQPAISRHLKLMVTAGLLQVRPEGGAKYYLPDRAVLQGLAEDLGGLFR